MTGPDSLLNQPVVIDNGSGTIKAGFAGEDLPKTFFSSWVGRPKHTRVLAGALEGDVFIGQRAQDLRGLLKIKYPLEHGVVTDWDDMERIWQYIYSEELKTLSEEVSGGALFLRAYTIARKNIELRASDEHGVASSTFDRSTIESAHE
jgi:actin-related protein